MSSSNGDGSNRCFRLPPPGPSATGFSLPWTEKTFALNLSNTVFVSILTPEFFFLFKTPHSVEIRTMWVTRRFLEETLIFDILETIFGQHSLKSTPFGVLIKNIASITI